MDGRLACCAAHAAGEILDSLSFPVEKAIDPTTPDGYLRIVGQMRRALEAATAEGEAQAIRDALRVLDVDWGNITADGRERVLEATRAAIGTAPARVMPQVRTAFRITGPRVMGEARRGSVRRFGLQIGTSLSQRDRAAERYVRISAGNFITDQYGIRRDELVGTARDIVARGLAEGSGRDAIAGRLHAALGSSVMRGTPYWQVVAGQFVNSARTFSQLGAFQEAGVERWVFEAVLDEVTTDICRYYHGKTFSVGASVATRDRLASLRDPSEIYDADPWLRTGRDAEGNRIIYFDRNGERTVVAQVERSGVGSRDDTGEYSGGLSSERLASEGAEMPPLHGNCRSTIEPLV